MPWRKSLNKKANIRHRYLGAATPKRAVDFIQNLTGRICLNDSRLRVGQDPVNQPCLKN